MALLKIPGSQNMSPVEANEVEVIEPVEPAVDAPNFMSADPATSPDYVVEVDSEGCKWRVYKDGRRLRSGFNHGPGRPKKAVRESLLKLVDKQAVKMLQAQLERKDLLPSEQAKWVELALRYGLGTSDETLVQSADIPQVLGKVLGTYAGHVIDAGSIGSIVHDLARELGLKGA